MVSAIPAAERAGRLCQDDPARDAAYDRIALFLLGGKAHTACVEDLTDIRANERQRALKLSRHSPATLYLPTENRT